MQQTATKGIRLLRTRSHPELVHRLGLPAAIKYDHVVRLYTVGGLGSLVCMATFMVTTSAGLQPIAIAALVIAFVVLLPCMMVATAMAFSVTNEVCRRWDIPRRSKPPLTTKALKNADRFDQWLAAHDRQPPAPPPYGTPPS
ncbi:MAG TPA: hypothetical protein VFJ09_05295 [Nocardioidaceae bacterium]|nr:hypothetical protein [Nocardioidaceae bacterium]